MCLPSFLLYHVLLRTRSPWETVWSSKCPCLIHIAQPWPESAGGGSQTHQCPRKGPVPLALGRQGPISCRPFLAGNCPTLCTDKNGARTGLAQDVEVNGEDLGLPRLPSDGTCFPERQPLLCLPGPSSWYGSRGAPSDGEEGMTAFQLTCSGLLNITWMEHPLLWKAWCLTSCW